jgi:predicted PurR-regulated permease PerM
VATTPVLDRAAAVTWKSLVVAGGVAVAVLALARLRILVLPAIVALLLATGLVPPVDRLQRVGLPRLVAVWLVLLASIGVLSGVVVLVAPTISDQFADLGPTVQEGIEEVENWLVEGPLDLSREEMERYRTEIVEQVQASGGSIASGVLAGAILAGEVVAGILLVLVLVFFFVKDGDKMCRFALDQVREENQALLRGLGRRVWTTIGGYLRGTALVALVDGVIIGIGLWIIGVPLVIPLSLLVFFGGFFPLVGAVVTGAVAVLVALVSGGPGDALLVLGVVVIVQQVESDVLAPLVLGRAVRLHPVVIIGALTAGVVIGGLIGAFLAVPVAAVAVAVSSELKARGIIGPGAPCDARSEEVGSEEVEETVDVSGGAGGTGGTHQTPSVDHHHEGRGPDAEGGEGGG